MSTRRFIHATACAAALAVVVFATRAEAQERLSLSVNWSKLAQVLRGGDWLLPQESWRPLLEQRSGSFADSPIIGTSPHVSLVARDWSGAQLLMGSLMLTDQLRLSRSCRMVLSRVRLTNGRFTPFVQVGIGQWRVDTDLVPYLPRDVEIAEQTGGGFEYAFSQTAAIALEGDYTILYREQHEPQMVAEPRPWVTFVAARARF
jgi:hypothetical protein